MNHADDLQEGPELLAEEPRYGGFTLDELAEYLDRGRTPRNPEIEANEECRSVLTSLARVRTLTGDALAAEATVHGHLDQPWVERVFSMIRADAREGRAIPVRHPHPAVRLSISERALRALIRACGDQVAGAVIGRVLFHGDIDVAGAPVAVEVRIALFMFTAVSAVAQPLRDRIGRVIRTHTDLALTEVNLVFTNVIPAPVP
ncbi:hypothetical protein, partial [Leucobacter sp. M11]|uniref:hypothetical protein n=1 Tax=Leucobacter sp. M11 TaxID=2993565 RepID=UPI002D811746